MPELVRSMQRVFPPSAETAMNVSCQLTRHDDEWSASHESADIGRIEVRAATREQALEKLRGEIRYRLELCPCTGESYRHIELDIQPET